MITHTRRRRPDRVLLALATGVGLTVSLTLAGPAGVATAAPPNCDTTQSPVQVTADCVDPTYARPVIDTKEDLTDSRRAPSGDGTLRGHQHPLRHLPPAGQAVARPLLPVHLSADRREGDRPRDRVRRGQRRLHRASWQLGGRSATGTRPLPPSSPRPSRLTTTDPVGGRSTATCTGRAAARTRPSARPRTPPVSGTGSFRW